MAEENQKMKLNNLTATELIEKLVRNEIDIVQICEDCYDRIDEKEKEIKIILEKIESKKRCKSS